MTCSGASPSGNYGEARARGIAESSAQAQGEAQSQGTAATNAAAQAQAEAQAQGAAGNAAAQIQAAFAASSAGADAALRAQQQAGLQQGMLQGLASQGNPNPFTNRHDGPANIPSDIAPGEGNSQGGPRTPEESILGEFIVTGMYPDDGGGGTGPALPPVPEVKLTPPSRKTGWGLALGVGGQFGLSWLGGLLGGSAGVYVDVGGGSIGFLYGGSYSFGLGLAASLGPQLAGFTDLNAFRGSGVGAQGSLLYGGSLTTPVTAPGSGYTLTTDLPGGGGGAVFLGGTTTRTETYTLFDW